MATQGNRRRRRSQPRHRGITSLRVRGYKSLADEQQIEIRPLTILAGVNSSGKSSILQPLLLMKQTLDAPYDPGPLQLDGSNVSVTSIEQVLSRQSKKQQVKHFSVGFTVNGQEEIILTFGKSATGELQLPRMTIRESDGQEAMTLSPNLSPKDVRALVPNDLAGTYERLRGFEGFDWRVVRDRCFLRVTYAPSDVSPSLPIGPTLFSSESAEREIASIIHLPGLRGNPARTYRTAAVESTFPGTFQAYTAGVVRAWQIRRNTDTLNQLRSDLEELGLTWKVEARQIDDTRVELLVGRLPHARQGGAQDLVNIVDVGFGVSQSLPVMVALLVARFGQLVYLEQPEIHLHPRAQVHFASVAARAARRGVRVIIETHSSLIIRGIQTLVAKGDLDPDLVKMHWFTRSPSTGFSNVVSGDLDEEGAFGDWPEDFDDVLLESERSYLDAAGLKFAERT
jgi:predicted ATPase